MSDVCGPLQKRFFAGFAWFVLAYNLIVIMWGAVVRATKSGAGCGEHWPLCQDAFIPHATQIATVIEFVHRASSGIAVALVLGLLCLAFRRFPSRYPVRHYAAAAFLFTLMEGLLGAALVIFGKVGSNPSAIQVLILSLHLVNTFLLIALLALCARSASVTISVPNNDEESFARSPYPLGQYVWYAAGLFGTIGVAVTGTIAALADGRLKATSLAQAFRSDFSGSSEALLRLRIIHPFIAVAVGALLMVLTLRAFRYDSAPPAKRLAKCLLALVFFQFALGLFNVLLLTPLSIQILHLLTADLIWIVLVLLSGEMLGPWRVAKGVHAEGTDAEEVASCGAFGR